MRTRELAERPRRLVRPLRMAYADPPYPGLSSRYYKGESSYAGEIDHVALLEQLRAFDGWALSTGSFALRELLPLCPDGARVCAWVKPTPPRRGTYGVHGCWEPVIVVPGRRLRPGKRDWLLAAPARLGGSQLPGRKPIAFVAWMFALLGLLPGDDLVDLFPGSGVVSSAWCELQRTSDASLPAAPRHVARETRRRVADDVGATGRAEVLRDGSRVGRRRRVPLGEVADV